MHQTLTLNDISRFMENMTHFSNILKKIKDKRGFKNISKPYKTYLSLPLKEMIQK